MLAIQQELKKIKNVTVSKDLKEEKIQIQKSAQSHKNLPQNQFRDDFKYERSVDETCSAQLKL